MPKIRCRPLQPAQDISIPEPANDNLPAEPVAAAAEAIAAAFRAAGATLLSIRSGRDLPAGFRVAWPEYAPDPELAYGYGRARMAPAVPSAGDISRMDVVLGWPGRLIPGDDPEVTRLRRILLMRAMCDPISGRHLFSFGRIGDELRISREWARKEHEFALRLIVARLAGVGEAANDNNAAGAKGAA